MRIGTWNLAGRWSAAHLELLTAADVDVWLLTEVSERITLPDHDLHLTAASMAPRRRWAAVATRPGCRPLPDPHPASAAATVGETTFVASVLPWRGTADVPPWRGASHAERTAAAVGGLLGSLPSSGLVWGGDWNHALTGPEVSGTLGGRSHVLAAVARLDLVVPTADLGRSAGRASIDHIAVPARAGVRRAGRIDHGGLSDHDAYVVEIDD